MFGLFKKKQRFNDDEVRKLKELFRNFRGILPKTLKEAVRLCNSGEREKGLELLMSIFLSGIPIIGFSDPAMIITVSELALQHYEAGNRDEGLHFETLRWIIHLRVLGISEVERSFIWSGADPKLHPDDDVRGYYAVDSGKLENKVDQSWNPPDPALMQA